MQQSLVHGSWQCSAVITKLLQARQLITQQQVQDFFSWDLNQLPDLTALFDLTKGAQRIIQAVLRQEKIGIFGDYDVDGTTACALLFRFFQMIGVPVSLYQPSRFVDGYGLSPAAITTICDQQVQVLITVDCGITSFAAAKIARAKNLDLIITDHHQDSGTEELAAFAVINPNRRDEPPNGPLRALAGVGVAFALALKIKQLWEAEHGTKLPTLYPLLQYVAIGTIADLAPLNTVNLKLVRHGLKQLPQTNYLGLKQFFSPQERLLPIISSEKIAFQIGPMINAKGRMDTAEKALQLLTTDDPQEALWLYQQLEVANNERKYIQQQVFQEAEQQIRQEMTTTDHLISIAYGPHWHEGVIGIVASKLVEQFKVPALVFTNTEIATEQILKGSARSAGELNLYQLLSECQDLFTKFGGHHAAAGLSLTNKNLPLLQERLKRQLQAIPALIRTQQLNYDLELRFHEITPELALELEMFWPYGNANPQPIFLLRNCQLANFEIMKGKHVRWTLSSLGNETNFLKGISFNYLGKLDSTHPEQLLAQHQNSWHALEVYFSLSFNYFKNNKYLQLQIHQIARQEGP